MAYSTASGAEDPEHGWCLVWRQKKAKRDRYEIRQDFGASIRSGMVKPVLVHAVPDGDGGTLSGVTEGMHERQEVCEV